MMAIRVKYINLSIKELNEICDHLPLQQGKGAYESLKVPNLIPKFKLTGSQMLMKHVIQI